MTNDQIIEMAKQAGFYAPDAYHKEMLIAFARLIAEKQREEDAEIAEDFGYRGKEAADAIRNSGGE
jgi:hypothetical protein